MARTTVHQDLKTIVELGLPPDPLVMPVMDFPAVAYAGKTYDEYSTRAEMITEVWNWVIQRFDLDWAGIFVDDLFEYEPLGIGVAKHPGMPYAVAEYLPATPSTLRSLRLPDPRKDGRMPMRLEAQQRLRDRWGRNILISASVAAPFTGLTLAFGIQPVMLMLLDNPSFLREGMKFIEDLAITWGRALLAGGADLIWLGDCSASSRFIPLDTYRDMVLGPARRVTKELQAAGAKVIYHAGENRLASLEAMVETGADILSVEGRGAAMGAVKDAVGDRIGLIGNIDSINGIWHSTPASIKATVHTLVTETARRGGYIVSPGEVIPQPTPIENFEALVTAIRDEWKGIAT